MYKKYVININYSMQEKFTDQSTNMEKFIGSRIYKFSSYCQIIFLVKVACLPRRTITHIAWNIIPGSGVGGFDDDSPGSPAAE